MSIKNTYVLTMWQGNNPLSYGTEVVVFCDGEYFTGELTEKIKSSYWQKNIELLRSEYE